MSFVAKSPVWPGHPSPLPDETFSSWFRRLACSNGVSAPGLYRAVLPGSYLHSRDLDRFACDELIAGLGRNTAVPEEEMTFATLRRWTGYLFEEDDGKSKLLWLPPAGWEDSKKSFGQQVCPKCLAEDEVPYLRMEWRLAFVTACPRDSTLLIDRCPACAEPIQILKNPSPTDLGVSCWKCGRDYSRAIAPPSDKYIDLRIQKDLLETAVVGWKSIGEYGSVYSLVYFRILMSVYRLLATGKNAYPLRFWLSSVTDGNLPPASNIPRTREVELLNPRCRQVLIRMSHWLLEEWPHRFVAACRAIGLVSSDLLRYSNAESFAYWDAVTRHLSRPTRKVSAEEIESAKRFLNQRGEKPTYPLLRRTFGARFWAHRRLAEPASECVPYGTHRYWKLDGVTPEVRTAAKAAARKNGENIGPWVDRILKQALDFRGQKSATFSSESRIKH